jgi:hypothetical protein
MQFYTRENLPKDFIADLHRLDVTCRADGFSTRARHMMCWIDKASMAICAKLEFDYKQHGQTVKIYALMGSVPDSKLVKLVERFERFIVVGTFCTEIRISLVLKTDCPATLVLLRVYQRLGYEYRYLTKTDQKVLKMSRNKMLVRC